MEKFTAVITDDMMVSHQRNGQSERCYTCMSLAFHHALTRLSRVEKRNRLPSVNRTTVQSRAIANLHALGKIVTTLDDATGWEPNLHAVGFGLFVSKLACLMPIRSQVEVLLLWTVCHSKPKTEYIGPVWMSTVTWTPSVCTPLLVMTP